MWSNPRFPANLVTFTEEFLNGKFHFLCKVSYGLSYRFMNTISIRDFNTWNHMQFSLWSCLVQNISKYGWFFFLQLEAIFSNENIVFMCISKHAKRNQTVLDISPSWVLRNIFLGRISDEDKVASKMHR